MKKNKRRALIISLCLLAVWSLLGTQASLAWFTDTTPVSRNTFIIGNMGLAVSYKNQQMTDYAPMDEDSAVFDDRALYEPNYTQVVRLQVQNTGDIDFDYRLLVNTYDFEDSVSVLGNRIHLANYLKFGVVFADSETQLDRELAQTLATEDRDSVLSQFASLDGYYKNDTVSLAPGQTRHVAIIIYMPYTVGNEANHAKGQNPPQIKMGVTVYAQQAGTPMD